MNIGRQRFARRHDSQRGQYLGLITEREQLGGSQPDFDIRMFSDRLYQRLHFACLGH